LVKAKIIDFSRNENNTYFKTEGVELDIDLSDISNLLAKVPVRCDGLSTFTVLLLTPPILVPYIRNCLALCMVTLSGAELTMDS
jgi:hypothetical protein